MLNGETMKIALAGGAYAYNASTIAIHRKCKDTEDIFEVLVAGVVEAKWVIESSWDGTHSKEYCWNLLTPDMESVPSDIRVGIMTLGEAVLVAKGGGNVMYEEAPCRWNGATEKFEYDNAHGRWWPCVMTSGYTLAPEPKLESESCFVTSTEPLVPGQPAPKCVKLYIDGAQYIYGLNGVVPYCRKEK